MLKKCIYLSTCDTCMRIIKGANLPDDVEMYNLKNNPIQKSDLEFLRSKVDAYKDLINKRSRKIKALSLEIDDLSESELKAYLIKEYTLVKRPIFIFGDDVFIGNSKKTIESLNDYLSG